MRPVHFEKQGNLGVVTIDNPPINLADNPLFAAFTEVLDEVDFIPMFGPFSFKRRATISAAG
jgi:enoyl-CoA hydratase/carnithine racemase